MNNLARKWISALKSGKYKQTKGCLHNKEGYCCLGVLQAVYRKQNPKFRGKNGDCAFPKTESLIEAGISEEVAKNLATINDSDCDGTFQPVIEYLESKKPFKKVSELKNKDYTGL